MSQFKFTVFRAVEIVSNGAEPPTVLVYAVSLALLAIAAAIAWRIATR
jgi:hypothetical protein